MDAQHLFIRDLKLINSAEGQSVAVEFGDGRVRSFSAQGLYDASRFLGQAESEPKAEAQRRAEELLASRRERRWRLRSARGTRAGSAHGTPAKLHLGGGRSITSSITADRGSSGHAGRNHQETVSGLYHPLPGLWDSEPPRPAQDGRLSGTGTGPGRTTLAGDLAGGGGPSGMSQFPPLLLGCVRPVLLHRSAGRRGIPPLEEVVQ